MVTRVRIDASGPTAAAVEHSLAKAGQHIDADLLLEASFGEQVIERSLEEPAGSRYAFKGRLMLHPNVAPDAPQERVLALPDPPSSRTLPPSEPPTSSTSTGSATATWTGYPPGATIS